jgi:hypothetical protein
MASDNFNEGFFGGIMWVIQKVLKPGATLLFAIVTTKAGV